MAIPEGPKPETPRAKQRSSKGREVWDVPCPPARGLGERPGDLERFLGLQSRSWYVGFADTTFISVTFSTGDPAPRDRRLCCLQCLCGRGRGEESFLDQRRRRHGIVDGRPQVAKPTALFELEQLAHEVEVGRDDRSTLLDRVERVHHRPAVPGHQVGDHQRRRPRHARLTVNEHLAATTARRLCHTHRNIILQGRWSHHRQLRCVFQELPEPNRACLVGVYAVTLDPLLSLYGIIYVTWYTRLLPKATSVTFR